MQLAYPVMHLRNRRAGDADGSAGTKDTLLAAATAGSNPDCNARITQNTAVNSIISSTADPQIQGQIQDIQVPMQTSGDGEENDARGAQNSCRNRRKINRHKNLVPIFS